MSSAKNLMSKDPVQTMFDEVLGEGKVAVVDVTQKTSVPELKEVDCCARCDHYQFNIETMDRAYFSCLHHTEEVRSFSKGKTTISHIDVEPYNLCKDFSDAE